MTREQQDVAGCKIMIQICSTKKTIRWLMEPDPTVQPQMRILEYFGMNKKKFFTRQMNTLCHKCIMSYSHPVLMKHSLSWQHTGDMFPTILPFP